MDLATFNISFVDIVNFTELIFLFVVNAFIFVCIGKIHKLKVKNYSLIRKNANIRFDHKTIFTHLGNQSFKSPEYTFCWRNEGFKYEIAIVVSLDCHHCGEFIQDLIWLKDIYPNICYKLIFDLRGTNHCYKEVLVSYLYYLYNHNNVEEFIETTKAWYDPSFVSSEKIKEKIDLINLQIDDKLIESQKLFCEIAKPEYLPAIYINGRPLSYKYSYKDMSGILQCLSKN